MVICHGLGDTRVLQSYRLTLSSSKNRRPHGVESLLPLRKD